LTHNPINPSEKSKLSEGFFISHKIIQIKIEFNFKLLFFLFAIVRYLLFLLLNVCIIKYHLSRANKIWDLLIDLLILIEFF